LWWQQIAVNLLDIVGKKSLNGLSTNKIGLSVVDEDKKMPRQRDKNRHIVPKHFHGFIVFLSVWLRYVCREK